jgi:uncharacterized membrane protein YvbJ
MTNLSVALNPVESNSIKKSFYISEILMLKSIIVLLVLTFFLLNEMQASNKEVKQLKRAVVARQMENTSNDLLSIK